MEQDLTVGIGATASVSAPSDAGTGASIVVPLGPAHPSTHGMLQLRLTVDGDQIRAADPLVGFLHRGAEKLFEARDYRALVGLVDRHDWLSSFGSELGVVLAAERMLGMPVPERAVWIRTVLAELTRIQAHLAFLAADPLTGAELPDRHVAGLRETVLSLTDEVSGARMHPMLNRVGGLAADLPEGWLERARATTRTVRRGLPAVAERIGSAEFRAASEGVGIIRPEAVVAYGVSGPAARASGVDLDVRRDEPYLAYGELFADQGPGRVVTRQAGDALARFECLVEQVEVSCDLVDACLDRLADMAPGPVGTRLPKVLRLPEGATYAWTENPPGINGYYLVSRGGTTPWRLKLRSASFNNVSVLPTVLPGLRVRDLTVVLASLFFVVGDIDK